MSTVKGEKVVSSDALEYQPLPPRGKFYFALILLLIVALLVYGAYEYLSLPDQIPHHFDFQGQPTSYGKKEEVLFLSLLFVTIPILLLLLIRFRFFLINRYPYFLSFPAFFTKLERFPVKERPYWINQYFTGLAMMGFAVSVYLFILEIFLFSAMAVGQLPAALSLYAMLMPLGILGWFFWWLRKLARRMDAAIVR